MANSTTRRGISAVTFALGLSLVLAACGGDDDGGDGDGGGDEDTTGLGAGADCDALVEEHGDVADVGPDGVHRSTALGAEVALERRQGLDLGGGHAPTVSPHGPTGNGTRRE